MRHAVEIASSWILIVLLVGIPLYGWVKGVKVYEEFVEGAKEGFSVALRIIPFLVAILAAVGAFRGAGAMDALAKVLAPITGPLGLPAEVLPMALVRPQITRRGSCRPASAARIFPTPSSIEISCASSPPNGIGSSVSSMVSAETPAVSSSSTVRLTLKALP